MKKILIIDDQREVRELLARAVSTFGYEHRVAGDGNEAIALCRTWKPDAIVTDIFMPDKDGLEIIRELRKAAFRTPVIAMSGGGTAGDLDILRTARLMGAKHVLTKPFPMRELKRLLQALFSADETAQKTPQAGGSASGAAEVPPERNA